LLPFLKRYAVTRLWLLLALSLLVLICYVTSRYSARLMMSDIWLNPIPIVLGMFLHSLLSSRRAPDEPHPTNARTFVLAHPDLLIEVPLIVTALVVLVSAT